MLVISATGGIEITARRVFEMAKQRGLALAIVVNKCDGENVDLLGLFAELQESFGTACRMANVPVGQGSGFSGTVDALKDKTGDGLVDVADAHRELVESIVEADEGMMERYFADEEISLEELETTFIKAMVAGNLIPVFFVSARNEIGIDTLLDGIVEFFPNPQQGRKAIAIKGEGDDATKLVIEADPSKPLLANVFKVTSDPFVGKLGFMRVWRGTLQADSMAHVFGQRKESQIGRAHV